jgi:hypothetical protein
MAVSMLSKSSKVVSAAVRQSPSIVCIPLDLNELSGGANSEIPLSSVVVGFAKEETGRGIMRWRALDVGRSTVRRLEAGNSASDSRATEVEFGSYICTAAGEKK